MYVANVTVDGEKGDLPDGEMQFHADQCYYETADQGRRALRARDALEGRQHAVLQHLSRLRAACRARSRSGSQAAGGVHLRRLRQSLQARADQRGLAELHASDGHHASGDRPAGAVRQPADGVVDRRHAARPRARRCWSELFQYVERPENVYEHVWRVGDALIWDNLATLHARTDFDPKERRALRRTAIRGIRPQAYSEQRVSMAS